MIFVKDGKRFASVEDVLNDLCGKYRGNSEECEDERPLKPMDFYGLGIYTELQFPLCKHHVLYHSEDAARQMGCEIAVYDTL